MILFKDFTKLSQSELEMILKWRNDERINHFFVHQVVELNEHFAFVKSLKNDTSKKYFLVFDDEKPIGVVNFININKDECEFGLYQNPNLKGFGKVLLKNLVEYAFENLGIKTLNARAFNHNAKASALYLNFGFALVKQDKTMSYFRLGGGGSLFAKRINTPNLRIVV